MTARTETEIYRPFNGRIAPQRGRFLPLLGADIRVSARNRIAMLLLFAPVTIAMIALSFLVYAKFALQSGAQPSPVAAIASNLVEVRTLIIHVFFAMGYFSLLVVAWYGSGLISEDRRLGAHTLYFARPLTLVDYFLAKLLALSFYGALAVLVPSLVICLVAVFSSPDWSFLRQEGRLIWQVILFGGIWIVAMASLMLCVSSLAPRKTFALVGAFALFVMLNALGFLLEGVLREPRFRVLSPDSNLRRIAAQVFQTREIMGDPVPWEAWLSWLVLGVTVVLAWCVTCARIRRMETS